MRVFIPRLLWAVLYFIVELDLEDVLRSRGTMTEIDDLEDHMVICGAGMKCS